MAKETKVPGWTTDYSKLESGDVFELWGLPDAYIVQNVQCNPGGGVGMGSYPDTWHIDTNMGSFTFDPWASHTYRRYRVVRSVEVKTDKAQLDAVYNDKTLKERRERAEMEQEWKCEKAEKARLREEAMKWMTPEQREAFEP